MAEEKLTFPHSLVLEERKNLSVSGVSDVDSFDEDMIIAFTDLGELTIKGSGLHISQLNTQLGELNVEGNVTALIYSTDQPRAAGFLGKLFR
ncbi:MAG: sporulation protein YabP [Acutalibacteraceae bacterium]|nr:sporulation protein YabP [Oscillospiraceae bacterium]